MAKRDPERTRKMRIAVRYLLERNNFHKGDQSRLAEHFHVSRQRVHQIFVEERQRLLLSRSQPVIPSASAVDGVAVSILGAGAPGIGEGQAAR